jgi:hypothetical protein
MVFAKKPLAKGVAKIFFEFFLMVFAYKPLENDFYIF